MPLLWISLSLICGIIFAFYLPWSSLGWLALAAACLALWPLLRRLPEREGLLARLRWAGYREMHMFVQPVLLLAFFFIGAWRISISAPDLGSGHIAAYNDQGSFRIQAVVDAPPDRRDKSTQLRLRVERVAPLDEAGKALSEQPAYGQLLALLPAGAEYQYGDRLRMFGKPVTPPEAEDFSYRDYLARQGVYSYLMYPGSYQLDQNAGSPILAAIYRARDWAYLEIYRLFPAPEAPLLAGILLGMDNDMPDSLAQAFRDTGTAHIIAISGFNIAILAGLFSKLFGRILSRWWALLASVVAITVYTLMVGATPSVVRAAIMGGLSLLAQQIGRRSAGLNTLFFTAGVMCLQNPNMPWDASFQLSFGATAGLILYGERLQDGFTGLLERRFSAEAARRVAGPVGEYVLLTLAAQLLTLPIILYHFQRLSISSLLANPLVLPPQPLVMVLSGVAVLAGAVSQPLAQLIAWMAWPVSAYTIRMIELLARIPGGAVSVGEMNLGTVALMYAVVLAPLARKSLPEKLRELFKPALLVTLTALASAILWRAVFFAPDGRMHLTVFDMNGSQVVLIRAPAGETLLINGGPSPRLLNDALGRWLSPFERRLDGVLVNSPASSNAASLASILDRYPPAQVWYGCAIPKTRTANPLGQGLISRQTPTVTLVSGNSLAVGSDVRLEVLATGDESAALLLNWQNFRVLIPGGFAPDQFDTEDSVNVSALLLEPRDLTKNPPDDWQALAPIATIFTQTSPGQFAGEANWLPIPPQGWISIVTDGKQMWLEKK